MAAMKLVRNLLMLILFCAEIPHMKGMRAGTEEEEAPDAHIVYDQRQSGKFNIHVVIKDVAIIEMEQNELADQSYTDEDYYYDEEDLTIKPLNIKTTTTSSVKPLLGTGNEKTTTPGAPTTTLQAEGQTGELSSNATPEITGQNSNATTTAYNEKDFMKNSTTYRPAVETKSRSKVEPIYAIEERVIQPRYHLGGLNFGMPVEAQPKDSPLARENSKMYSNSRILKVKVHRSQSERCRSNQYRDTRGNCRGKKSSSGTILKRLFRMLLTLPFKQDDPQIQD